jgi:hypothetical protein
MSTTPNERPNPEHQTLIETPSSKYPTPEKHRATILKQICRAGLSFGAWSFFGVWCLVFGVFSTAAFAQFVPIALTQASYNRDLIVESNAPVYDPTVLYTTASMDAGVGNTANAWYERGFNTSMPNTGLLHPGSTFTSTNDANHIFKFPPSYTTNDVVMVDSATTGYLILTTPAAYTALSFLTSAGHGPSVDSYTINFQDGSIESGTITSWDWFTYANTGTTDPVAFFASGRWDVSAKTFDIRPQTVTNPALYQVDVAVANSTGLITNIVLGWSSGSGSDHAAYFALSGATTPGGVFNPISLDTNSFNADMVMEAAAAAGARPLTNNTTASMQSGNANSGFTYYEMGYDPSNPTTGVPNAGTTFTSLLLSDHSYTMAPSFTTNDVVFVQTNVVQTTTITLASPAAYSMLSFLCAGAKSNVAVKFIIRHADTSYNEIKNNVIIPEWTGPTNADWAAYGAVDLATASPTNVFSGTNYSLFAVDVTCTNASPVTTIDVTWLKGLTNSHAAIFAVSGISAGGSGGTLPPFRVTSEQRLSPTQFKLTWDSVAGHNYQILSATSMPPVWRTNATVPATTSSTTYTDTVSTARSFYRVLGNP